MNENIIFGNSKNSKLQEVEQKQSEGFNYKVTVKTGRKTIEFFSVEHVSLSNLAQQYAKIGTIKDFECVPLSFLKKYYANV